MPPKVKLSRHAHSGAGLAGTAALAAFDKKAEDIVVLDLTDIESAPSDYFVICTCSSTTQVKAVGTAVENTCREIATQLPRSEGWETEWIIIDCFDVVVHVMTTEAREFYKLEKLWGDAKFSRLSEEGKLIAEKNPNAKVKKAAIGE